VSRDGLLIGQVAKRSGASRKALGPIVFDIDRGRRSIFLTDSVDAVRIAIG
jgi:hypothetical protein